MDGNIEYENATGGSYLKKVGKNITPYGEINYGLNGVKMSSKIEHLVKLSNGGFKKKKVFRENFPKIIQTGEDLFFFLSIAKEQRGVGQTVKKAVLGWIYSKGPNRVKKELSKNAHGFDGLDVLRIFHPKPINPDFDKAFEVIKKNCKRVRRHDYENRSEYL